MAFLKVDNVAIKGLSACVPPSVEENKDIPFYAPGEAEKIIASTGIERRHIAGPDICVSDLCFKAAERLIEELGWDKESIDLLAFCTQNPDYRNQPTSFLVHERLGLKENTMCLDFFHGCPGWVMSLSSVSSMLSASGIKRALLLVGDTVSKDQNQASRESRPLFGDCCTATALEYKLGAPSLVFNVGTMSDGGKALILTQGGYRNPYTHETLEIELARRAGTLTEGQTDDMDGMDVFSFAITKVPKAMKKLCAEYEINLEGVDHLVLHQANKLIVDAIAKRMKMPSEKVPLSLHEYGNTTSASIPLTIVSECANDYRNGCQKTLVCGFGTGLSWGAAYFETNNIVVPEVIIFE
jgi:3-oxoacyl-[acyl-carrier-protein] synthase-3